MEKKRLTKERLTVGCRARIVSNLPTPKKRKSEPGFGSNCHGKYPDGQHPDWEEFLGREVILIERTSGGSFSVLVLVPGTNVPLTRGKQNVVDNQIAWVSEESMKLVDSDFNTNLAFIDWYEEHEENYCGYCGKWHTKSTLDFEFKCSNKQCPGRQI